MACKVLLYAYFSWLSPSHHDPTLFLKSYTSIGCILFSLHVDDIIIIGDDVDKIIVLESYLTSHFKTKDLGSIQYFLGIEVASSPKGYLLSQSKHIIHILDLAHLIDTTLEVNVQYSSFDGNPLL